jgi:calcineurin-like phosphoesterase family protein
VLYTSDLHIGHQKVAGIRGFATTDDHDLAMAERWRAQVQPEDHVWILGDLSMNMAKGLDWIAPLPGTKHLITGNHDKCFPGHRNSWKVQRTYLEHFRSVQLGARHKICGTSVLLSHFPYLLDRGPESRDIQWRLRDEGGLLLHGHLHSPVKLTSPRELHVGPDAWGRLVTRDDVAELFGLSEPDPPAPRPTPDPASP